jgi:hypothetical protein
MDYGVNREPPMPKHARGYPLPAIVCYAEPTKPRNRVS